MCFMTGFEKSDRRRFDVFVETACQPYYAPKMGAPSVPPGRYFPHAHGWLFRGIASERGMLGAVRIRIRCAIFYGWRTGRGSDHSWLSKTRGRLPHEVHESVFAGC